MNVNCNDINIVYYSVMSYQLYRNTTLGHTLQESLDELIQV